MDRVREDITGAFRVSSKKKNGRRVVYFCAKLGCVCTICISSTSMYKYTWMVRQKDGIKFKSMMYLVSVKRKEIYSEMCVMWRW